MPIANGQVMALALKSRDVILATWYANLTGGQASNYWTLPASQLYARIAAHYGPKTEGDYCSLPISYAYHDIYIAVGGVETYDYTWGEAFALANIYAALRGHQGSKGKIAGYRELGKQILLALIAQQYTPVAAPSNLVATGVSASQINLSWTDNSSNELGFKIERSTDNINFTQIAQVGAGVTTYQSTGLDEGVQYYYRVRAFQGAVNSQYSNTASAATILTAPSLLTATTITDVRIDLAWQDNSSGETGFRIERSTDNINFTQIAEVGANVTTYQSVGLADDTQYYYRVRAYRTTVTSAYSNTANSITWTEEAQDYFDRLDAVGALITQYQSPINTYIKGLVALGGAYWDTMGAHCIFAGVGYAGCLVPLRDGMAVPTSFNFVSGDHNSVTGLIGNGSTKYLGSNLNGNAFGQNDFSMSVYIHTIGAGATGTYIGTQNAAGSSVIARSGGTPDNLFYRNRSTAGDTTTGGGTSTGYVGTSRTVGAGHNARFGGNTTTITRASQTPANENISVFYANGTVFCDGRLKAYHIGPAITNSTLDGLQTTLFNAIT